MKKFLAIIMALVMVLSMVACGAKEPTTAAPSGGQTAGGEANTTPNEAGGQHYVFRVASDDEAWRPEAVIEAAKRLNAQLAAEGNPDTVEVVYEVVDDWTNSFTLWIQEDDLPEMVLRKLGMIYKYAQAGVFVPVDYVVNDEVYTAKVPRESA